MSDDLVNGAAYMFGKMMPIAEAQLDRAEKLEAMLKVAMSGLKFACNDRCSDLNPCDAKETLGKLEEMKREMK